MIETVLTGAAVCMVYLSPSIISDFRESKNFWGILTVNVLLGWTIIGWVGSLVWALIDAKKR
jgi:hypothetical protein